MLKQSSKRRRTAKQIREEKAAKEQHDQEVLQKVAMYDQLHRALHSKAPQVSRSSSAVTSNAGSPVAPLQETVSVSSPRRWNQLTEGSPGMN